MRVIFKHHTKGALTLEESMVRQYCVSFDIPFAFVNEPTKCKDDIPIGTTDFVLDHIGIPIKPDYYPNFMNQYFKRMIWKASKWPLEKVFIKPADRAKRFTGFVTPGTYSKKKKGPYWCSEIIQVFDEWRYYIIDGEVVESWWYESGDGIEKDAPEFPKDISIPEHWCGTLDMANSDKGFVLVEAHEPYAIGWYGSYLEFYIYGKFCIEGYQWMMENMQKDIIY